MTAKEEILNLIAAEDKTLAALLFQEQQHKQRITTFKEALATVEKTKATGFVQIVKIITKLLEEEQDAETVISDRVALSKTKKGALEQVASSFWPPYKNSGKILSAPPKPHPRQIPPRKTEVDYKDLRPDTDIYKVRELLRKTGNPMPLAEIVSELFGPEAAADVKQGKYASLRGTLVGYANENRFFTVESISPHVIGLIEFNTSNPPVPPPPHRPARKFDLKGVEQGS